MTVESDALHFHYDVDGNNFTSAGEASVQVKRMLRQMGYHPDLIRRISVAMYEGEINMVIHAKGGDADVYVTPDCITVVLKDVGPGIKDVELAMHRSWQQNRYNALPSRCWRHGGRGASPSASLSGQA